MNIDEISNQYQIPIEILKKYENWGFCGTKKKLLGSWEYDDSDLENLRIIMTLHNIGFETTEIETYMKLLLGQQTTDTERLQMLERVSSWMNTPPFRYFRPQKLPQYRQAGYSQCSKAFYSH